MPLTLKALRSKTVETTIEVQGETVLLTWAPGRYTGALETAFTDIVREASALDDVPDDPKAGVHATTLNADQNAAVRTGLVALLVSWDVWADDGTPVPITEEELLKLPPSFLLQCWMAIVAGNNADPQKAPNSDEP